MVDACTGPSVAGWLRSDGHTVFSVHENARGETDDAVLTRARRGNYILITNDKDFGELVYQSGKSHRGIILLRLKDETVGNKISVLKHVLDIHEDLLVNRFIIATEKTIRIMDAGTEGSEE
jgi:predicted nuclease of predicted toxin-antitoxin system